MVQRRVRKIAVTGVLSAVSMTLGLTGLGLIPWFNGLALTVLHVPVIIGAILEGPLAGVFIGLIFGVFSLVQAAVGGALLDAAFVNPLISVLPRLFIGPAAWALYALLSGQWGRKEPGGEYGPRRIFFESLGITAGALLGSLVNTVLVLAALWLFKFINWPGIIAVILSNGLIEAAVSAVIVLAVVSAWKGIPRRRGKSRLSREEDRGEKKGSGE